MRHLLVLPSRVVVFTAISAVLATSATGCHLWNRLWGKDTVDLSKANVQSMSVDLRKERKTICPREQVQMAVFADVVLEGEKDKKSLETWSGRGHVNKNDKIDFVEFAFHSELGDFDKDGWFAPNENILASTDKEFEIKTVYKRQPDKFSFTTKYKPDYQCIKGGGKDGQAGSSGTAGSGGQSGQSGSSGSDSQPGANGSAGGTGSPGGDGSNGGAGPRIAAFATMVKTPFYDKLVAIKISGDSDDFLLAPIDQPIVVHANGGAGGAGGSGGQGGSGGSGGSGNPGGQGGQGGSGGNGGKGGSGGAGGNVDLVFDSRYPELGNVIKLDVSGGAAGDAGPAGGAGSGGGGGGGITPNGSTTPAQSGQRGSDGAGGSQGSSGQPGPNGHSSSKAGAVTDKFSGLEGVSLLDDAPAATPDAPAGKAAKSATKKKTGGATK